MTEAWKQLEGQIVAGEFQLRQCLAGGEHSAVFVTEYGKRGLQKAAIKLVWADPENVELRLSLWKLATRLSHAHLIRLFQAGTCQLAAKRLLYVVMEYADEVLSQVLPQRPLTATEVHQMLEPTVDALAYLHSKGFVHSHLKPANIMAVDEQLKISSDGLCRIGEAAGWATPGIYDAPEIQGEGVSPAGDIWSLGVTLVESLTQHLPVWEGTELEEPLSPKTLPAPFLEIARHCLRRDPQRRWTVADIAAHLRQTSSARQQQRGAKPRATFAKWRYVGPAAALGIVLAAMLAGPRLLERRPDAHQDSSQFEKQRVQPEPEQKAITRETKRPARRTSDENQDSSAASPAPTPLRSSAGAKTPSGDLVRGKVVHEVLPDVPTKARNTIRGKVRVSVRIQVGPSGRVVSGKLDSPGPSKYFAKLALQAAQRWEFTPAKLNGHPVSSEWVLKFEFARTETNVFPVLSKTSIDR